MLVQMTNLPGNRDAKTESELVCKLLSLFWHCFGAGAAVDKGLGLGQEASLEGGWPVCRGVQRNKGAPSRRAGMASSACAVQHPLCSRVFHGQVSRLQARLSCLGEPDTCRVLLMVSVLNPELTFPQTRWTFSCYPHLLNSVCQLTIYHQALSAVH